ncbi:MAG: hypothetical protein QM811_17865 [Pirellulales bacterium]
MPSELPAPKLGGAIVRFGSPAASTLDVETERISCNVACTSRSTSGESSRRIGAAEPSAARLF